jgi:hypothetical protein
MNSTLCPNDGGRLAAEGGRPSKSPSLPKDQPIGSVQTTPVPGWKITTATEPAVPNHVTELARGAITAADTLTIELVEADETPAVVIIRWPLKATVLHIACQACTSVSTWLSPNDATM